MTPGLTPDEIAEARERPTLIHLSSADDIMATIAALEQRALAAESDAAKATAELDAAGVIKVDVGYALDLDERIIALAHERDTARADAAKAREAEAEARKNAAAATREYYLVRANLRDEIAAHSATEAALDSARRELEAEKRRADEATRHAETSDAMMRKARADEAQARQLIEAQTARAHESERRAAGLAGLVARAHAHLDALYSQRPTWLAEDVAAFEALRDGGVAR
jgi:hypothetical protein